MDDISRAYANRDLAGWQMAPGGRKEVEAGYWFNPRSGLFHSGKESRFVGTLRDCVGIIRRKLGKKA